VGEQRRRIFRLADAVEVVLVGASPRARGLDFSLAGMPEPKERPAYGRREERQPAKQAERKPRRR
jgi:hypothetical protein